MERFLQLLPKLGYDKIINVPDPTSQDMKRTLREVALEVDIVYDVSYSIPLNTPDTSRYCRMVQKCRMNMIETILESF